MDTSAIMGFMNALMDVIKREKPDHLAVAFDKGGSDYHEMCSKNTKPIVMKLLKQ
jgi:DNA polymerase-1